MPLHHGGDLLADEYSKEHGRPEHSEETRLRCGS
jgi:hypothetical protein